MREAFLGWYTARYHDVPQDAADAVDTILDKTLRLLPEWTQWCIGQSGLSGDFAARSRAAALTEAATLVYGERHDPAAEQDEAPFRRQE